MHEEGGVIDHVVGFTNFDPIDRDSLKTHQRPVEAGDYTGAVQIVGDMKGISSVGLNIDHIGFEIGNYSPPHSRRIRDERKMSLEN